MENGKWKMLCFLPSTACRLLLPPAPAACSCRLPPAPAACFLIPGTRRAREIHL